MLMLFFFFFFFFNFFLTRVLQNWLNLIFPSICSKILDCVINNLIVAPYPRRDCGFADILGRRTMGFYSEKYKDGRKGGSCGGLVSHGKSFADALKKNPK
jgi:hypothetical protein